MECAAAVRLNAAVAARSVKIHENRLIFDLPVVVWFQGNASEPAEACNALLPETTAGGQGRMLLCHVSEKSRRKSPIGRRLVRLLCDLVRLS